MLPKLMNPRHPAVALRLNMLFLVLAFAFVGLVIADRL